MIHISQINKNTIESQNSEEVTILPYEIGDEAAKANLADTRASYYRINAHGFLTFIRKVN